MFDLVKNLCKETRSLGLMRLGFCLDTMMKSVWFERQVPDYDRYSSMFPIYMTEKLNCEYCVRMLLGEPYHINKYSLLLFKEGKNPGRPPFGLGGSPLTLVRDNLVSK